MGNPNTLGEVAFLALLIFLPFSRHASTFIARTGLLGIVLCFLLFSISGGRANFIAGLVVLLLWAVLVPRHGPGTTRSVYLAVLGVFGVVAVVTLSGVSRRTRPAAPGFRCWIPLCPCCRGLSGRAWGRTTT